MVLKIKSLSWRVMLICLTLTYWVGAIAAQDDVAAPAEETTTQFGLIWFILAVGFVAILFLGFSMYSDTTSAQDSN